MAVLNFSGYSLLSVYDVLKIIAAFLVVFYHFGALNFNVGNAKQYIPNINYILYTLSAMSIPVFFMVNGALVLNKNYTNKQIINKIIKLIMLIVVWSVVDFPSWFLKTLIILYALYPLFKKLFNQNQKLLYLLICSFIVFPDFYNLLIVLAKGCSLCDFSIFSVANMSISDFPRIGLFTMYSIPLFLLGGMYFKKNRKYPFYISFLFILIGWGECIFESVIITRYTLVLHDSGNGNFPTIGALLMAIGLFNLLYDIELGEYAKNVVRFLSNNILMVYILHMFIIKIVKTTILADVSSVPLVLSLFVSMLIYLVCTFTSIVLSKIPVLRYFVKI